jgi:hypothetical protein
VKTSSAPEAQVIRPVVIRLIGKLYIVASKAGVREGTPNVESDGVPEWRPSSGTHTNQF